MSIQPAPLLTHPVKYPAHVVSSVAVVLSAQTLFLHGLVAVLAASPEQYL